MMLLHWGEHTVNANELVDKLDEYNKDGMPVLVIYQAASMLRQQQSEIQALKQIIDANNLNQNIGQFVKPANEPVAWMFQGAFDISTYVSFEKPNPDIYPNPTPLYTHPIKELDEQFEKGFKAGKEEGWKAHKFHHPAKTLTDEEIRHIQAICHLKDVGYDNFVMRFARAILRKAQEK